MYEEIKKLGLPPSKNEIGICTKSNNSDVIKKVFAGTWNKRIQLFLGTKVFLMDLTFPLLIFNIRYVSNDEWRRHVLYKHL